MKGRPDSTRRDEQTEGSAGAGGERTGLIEPTCPSPARREGRLAPGDALGTPKSSQPTGPKKL